jgi:NAD+ diphosphatase
LSFVPAIAPPSPLETAWLFVIRGAEVLVVDAETYAPPRAVDPAALGLAPIRTQFLGALDGVGCIAIEVAGDALAPSGHRFGGLRELHARMHPDHFAVAGTASQVLHWDRGHQFCAQCGGSLTPSLTDRAKRCATCRVDYYPRIHPAVIVLVHDGPRIMLARSPNFPQPWYALVAGFLEPGETLEECAAREVREETGIAIDDLRYFGSQPWPFPHQVMVGFFARYAGGEIVVDGRELEVARWFDAKTMPMLPPSISIARKMIDAWLDEQRAR